MTRRWIAGAAALAFVAAFLAASVAVGGEGDRKAPDRSTAVRLSAVAKLPTIAEDPAQLAERRAARRELLREKRRRAAALRAAAEETAVAAPAVPEAEQTAPESPEPVELPPAVSVPAPPPPPPETFDDSG